MPGCRPWGINGKYFRPWKLSFLISLPLYSNGGFLAHTKVQSGPRTLAYYLDEFTFRFNRRTSRQRGKLFYRLVQQALMVDPVPENELKAEIPSEENFDDLEF